MADPEDFDAELRNAAMRWLEARTNDGLGYLAYRDIQDFEFNGEPYRLLDAQAGIWKPKDLDSALAIRTTYRSDPSDLPYEDKVLPDGSVAYKWRKGGADFWQNRAVRAAMEKKKPLIWFFKVGTQPLYRPIYPIMVVREEPENEQFILAPEAVSDYLEVESPIEEHLRKYVAVEAKRRLHQPVFRSMVMRAYSGRCAVCAIGHAQLLDAAHIVADSESEGVASVSNGLALCKIHHAAYDSNILGISPDWLVHIRDDLLREVDGPMLEHGLQGRHRQKLMMLPRSRNEKPSRELLELRFREFRAA